MLSFEEERRIALAPSLLYGVVMDVGSYPLFLPWCLGAEQVSHPGDVARRLDVPLPRATPAYWRLDVGWGPVRESYISRVEGIEEGGEVLSYAVAGPLRHLETHWRIMSVGG
ncbi:MAG: hypothetical protein OD811_06055, partial [Alphaproteobacteria bacterium]